MRTFDEQWDDWKVGDLVVWEDDKEAEPMKITEIDAYERVHWLEDDGEDHLTRATNLLRVTEELA